MIFTGLSQGTVKALRDPEAEASRKEHWHQSQMRMLYEFKPEYS
jgi:hypothetical protein